jgi:hypothetical protein
LIPGLLKRFTNTGSVFFSTLPPSQVPQKFPMCTRNFANGLLHYFYIRRGQLLIGTDYCDSNPISLQFLPCLFFVSIIFLQGIPRKRCIQIIYRTVSATVILKTCWKQRKLLRDLAQSHTCGKVFSCMIKTREIYRHK